LALHHAGELANARGELGHAGRSVALGERLLGRTRGRGRWLPFRRELLEDRGQRLERFLEPIEAVLGHPPACLGDGGLRGAPLRGDRLLAVSLDRGIGELLPDLLEKLADILELAGEAIGHARVRLIVRRVGVLDLRGDRHQPLERLGEHAEHGGLHRRWQSKIAFVPLGLRARPRLGGIRFVVLFVVLVVLLVLFGGARLRGTDLVVFFLVVLVLG